MIDHVTLAVSNYTKAKAFYQQILSPLAYQLVTEAEGFAGFGQTDQEIADFWLYQSDQVSQRLHLAFLANSQQQVREFYQTALATGAKDNGPPGKRLHYHPSYYAAFVLDLDGHNIEAVCYQSSP